MGYLHSFGMGIAFVAGILVACTSVLLCFRVSVKKEKADAVASLLRLEEIHREKVKQLKRIADTVEEWKSEKCP